MIPKAGNGTADGIGIGIGIGFGFGIGIGIGTGFGTGTGIATWISASTLERVLGTPFPVIDTAPVSLALLSFLV